MNMLFLLLLLLARLHQEKLFSSHCTLCSIRNDGSYGENGMELNNYLSSLLRQWSTSTWNECFFVWINMFSIILRTQFVWFIHISIEETHLIRSDVNDRRTTFGVCPHWFGENRSFFISNSMCQILPVRTKELYARWDREKQSICSRERHLFIGCQHHHDEVITIEGKYRMGDSTFSKKNIV